MTPDRPAATAPAPAGFRIRRPAGQPIPSPQSGNGSPIGSAPYELADPLNGSTGTRSSADGQPAKLTLDKRAVKEICRGLVLMLTDAMHGTLARSAEEVDAEVWKSTEDEQKQIGDPLASIAVRHGNGLPGSPDVADLVKLGLGTLGYLARNTREAVRIRKAKRAAAKLTILPDPAEHSSGPAAAL